MVLIAPKVTEGLIRNAISYMKNKCNKLDVKVMIIYSRSDSVIPVGGSFLPWPGNYDRMNGANQGNNDVDGDGEADIIESEVIQINRPNTLSFTESHLWSNLVGGADRANMATVTAARNFLNEAN